MQLYVVDTVDSLVRFWDEGAASRYALAGGAGSEIYGVIVQRAWVAKLPDGEAVVAGDLIEALELAIRRRAAIVWAGAVRCL